MSALVESALFETSAGQQVPEVGEHLALVGRTQCGQGAQDSDGSTQAERSRLQLSRQSTLQPFVPGAGHHPHKLRGKKL